MAKLTNTERATITLPSGHVIPRLGELVCTNETIAANWPQLSGPIGAGQILVEYDPEPVEAPVKRKGKPE